MTVHYLPVPDEALTRIRLRNTLDACNTAHALVWHAVDECPDAMAIDALQDALKALEAACLTLMTLHPEER